MELITADLVRHLLNYDPKTGIFVWREREDAKKAWIARFSGKQTGCLNVYGYLVIKICGQAAPSHRLAWLYVYGRWPDHEIDHINGVKTDNRIINLRDVSRSENQQNLSYPQSNSRSGIRGVVQRGNKWLAVIMLNQKQIYLGQFCTKDEAAAAYETAKTKLNPYWVSPSKINRMTA